MPTSKNIDSYPIVFRQIIKALNDEALSEIRITYETRKQAINTRLQFNAYKNLVMEAVNKGKDLRFPKVDHHVTPTISVSIDGSTLIYSSADAAQGSAEAQLQAQLTKAQKPLGEQLPSSAYNFPAENKLTPSTDVSPFIERLDAVPPQSAVKRFDDLLESMGFRAAQPPQKKTDGDTSDGK